MSSEAEQKKLQRLLSLSALVGNESQHDQQMWEQYHEKCGCRDVCNFKGNKGDDSWCYVPASCDEQTLFHRGLLGGKWRYCDPRYNLEKNLAEEEHVAQWAQEQEEARAARTGIYIDEYDDYDECDEYDEEEEKKPSEEEEWLEKILAKYL